MNSFHDRSGDDPTDPRTRQRLWRLRARLVRPAPESRVAADLDAILAAAAANAHEAPDADASPRPGLESVHGGPDAVVRSVGAQGDGQEDGTVLPLARAGRRALLGQHVGKAAAVVVLVAAVGGGAAIATDADAGLQSLLSRTPAGEPADQAVAAPPDVDATGEPAPPDATEQGRQEPVDVAPLPEPDPLDGPAGALEPDTAVPSLDRSAPDPAAADDGTSAEREPAEGGNGTADSGRPSGGTGSGGGSTTQEGRGSSEGTSSDDAQPSPERAEPEPEVGGEEVLAAPEPDDLAGAGGPQPCDAEDLRDCLTEDDEDAGAEEVRDVERAREELAERRAQADGGADG